MYNTNAAGFPDGGGTVFGLMIYQANIH